MIEEIRAQSTMDGSEGLLAILIYYDRNSIEQGSKFITDVNNPLQIGIMRYVNGQIICPHIHLPRTRTFEQTQEFLCVRKGCIMINIYSAEKELAKSVTLCAGDCILLLSGGHSIESCGNSEVIECKLGPYTGREFDKINIQPNR